MPRQAPSSQLLYLLLRALPLVLMVKFAERSGYVKQWDGGQCPYPQCAAQASAYLAHSVLRVSHSVDRY